MNLTPNQTAAITHSGQNLQLIACAGSGKTEVVSRRIVHLLTPDQEYTLLPANIAAFTFTDKAAAELKDRAVRRTRELLGEITGMADMFIGTIHAFCLGLLKSESPDHLKYEVLNDVQQRLFIDRNSAKSGLTKSTDLKGARLRRYLDTDRYKDALSILREADTNSAALKNCAIVPGLECYRDLLKQKSYLDYSSILEEAVWLLQKDGDLRVRIAERIKYVIVDEYQDVNPIQEAIVSTLHELGAHVCVVGDDDQTIYQWRGSDVNNILTFVDRYPEVSQVSLEENFRSSEGVVNTARQFIEQNAERLLKEMQPVGIQPFEEGDIVALSFDNPAQEADYISETMLSLRGAAFIEDNEERGLSWSDMSVLLRSVRTNGDPIIQSLRAHDIPFVVSGMVSLFATPEAEAARQLFYFVAGRDGTNEESLRASWEAARTGITAEGMDAAIAGATAARDALDEENQGRWGLYSIQRVFLAFLENAGLCEEGVPDERGEILFYNLGKFSQVISDFEAIHFYSAPREKYETFAGFLEHQAEDAYPEGWQDNQYATIDAVKIMTVHQAKGMEWPVVFMPALLRNRFPSPRHGGRSVWHLLPREGINGQARYEGTLEDERRLFYVGMTRSQKFLHMTWAPIDGFNNWYVRPSEFWENILASKYVKRRRQNYALRPHIEPRARRCVANVVLSFSDLKYYFECPYQFKLRILYGFNAPIHEALGFGKSLHDALAEVHARAIRGDVATQDEVQRLVQTHLHSPYAYPDLRLKLQESAERILSDYLTDNAEEFANIEFSEKNVEVNLGDGVTVTGRIDLVRRKDTNETTIVDLKSSERAQAEEVTEAQLHVYALGYQDLTGRHPDFVEIYELDERKRKPRSVDEDFIADVKVHVQDAASSLRTSTFPVQPTQQKCSNCDYCGMCSAGREAVSTN